MGKTPSNHGKDWTAGDIKKLGQLARQNTPTKNGLRITVEQDTDEC